MKDRLCLIPREHKADLQKYITGIVRNKKHKLIAIENEPDHIHIMVGLKPDQAISDLVKDIKTGSTLWLNGQSWMVHHFSWQEGFGAFSYSRSQLSQVIAYIQNQEQHQKKKTFREEYLAMLEAFGIEYDERYLFDFWNNISLLRSSEMDLRISSPRLKPGATNIALLRSGGCMGIS